MTKQAQMLNAQRNDHSTMSHFRILSMVIFCLLLSGCERGSVASDPAKVEPPVDVKVVHPFRGEITRSITLPGEVKAYQVATLYAKVAGYLKKIAADKGDQVKKGALLAEIEAPELLADRAKYKAEIEVAELDYKRLLEAQKKAPDLVTPLSVDTARSKSAVAKANLDRAETLLEFTRISAPFSGVVTRRFVDPGAFIPAATSGSAAQNAALLTLMNFGTVRIQVAVPESESSRIAREEPAKITVEGLPGRAFEGKITRFSYALDEATKTMLAEIELPNPKLELRPGMYATVKIGIERKENALLVPTEALLMEKANASVFTVANNKVKKLPVKIGFNDGMHAEILSDVQPGQGLILLSKRAFTEGQPVHVVESD
jgi:membrane fusion protein, multidrug efflux system